MIGVVGVGNLLLKDDGVGIHVIKRLRKLSLPLGDVELVDGGTASFSIHIRKYKKLIIVDAVKSSCHPPATILLFDKSQILNGNIEGVFSSHDVTLFDYLALLEIKGEAPEEVLLIGIVPREFETPDTSLTPEVEHALDKVIKIILEKINEWSNNNTPTKMSH